MNEQEQTDEFLNSYIDGELSPRQRTEVKRLVAHDDLLRRRLRQFRNSRILLRSLPREEPPAEIVDNVLAMLERKTLLGERGMPNMEPSRRFRLLRKIRAAAAVLILLGALSVLVYSIVAPSTSSLSVSQIAGEIDTVPEDDTAVAQITGVESSLELKLAASTDLAGLLNGAIARQGIDTQVQRHVGLERQTFNFTCSRSAVGGVLDELNAVWGAVNEATLRLHVVGGDTPDIVLQRASPVTVARILGQVSPQESWAVANLITEQSLSGTWEAGRPAFRPMLTSGDAKDEKSSLVRKSLLEGEETVALEIILIYGDD